MRNITWIKCIGLLLFVTMIPIFVCAQNITVKGIVQDAKGDPLIGANVLQVGTTNGVITDLDGRYQLNVPPNTSISFSYIGHITQTIPVNNRRTINVVLKEDSKALDEVVVVGYGSIKKSDISGSVASVDTEAMMKKAPTNIAQALQGSAAGVLVTAQDGAPDANAAVRVRGVATINGNANPLYVVDGIQVGSNASFVNPADIESIEVLKDASATAIYGAAGANGVIMITTKHGSEGSLMINFSADFAAQTLARKLDVCDVDQYAFNVRSARANDDVNLYNQVWSSQYDGKRNAIDWQDQMTHAAFKQQYNLSASGGSEKLQANFSLGYLDNSGIIVNTNYKRLTSRSNLKAKIANFIEFGGDINFVHTETKGSNSAFNNNGNLSSIRDLAFMCPSMDYVDTDGRYVRVNVVNPDGTYGTVMQGANVNDGFDASTDNIYARQQELDGKNRNNNVFTSAYLEITLLKGLKVKSIGSYSMSSYAGSNFEGNRKRYNTDASGNLTEVTQIGYDARYRFGLSQSQYNSLGIETYATYNWSNKYNNLTLMIGNSVSSSWGEWVSADAVDFPGENVRKVSLTTDRTTVNGDGAYNLKSRGISYYGRVVYSLLDRYIVTGTVRRDGSSNFGAGNRWATFPSAAVAWRVSEEDFMKSVTAITNLKLRFGWGQTGNSGGATDLSVPSLSTNNVKYLFFPQYGNSGAFGTNASFVTGYKVPLVDTNLKWETNEQTNVGIDIGLLENTINITADYFIRKSKDLLLYRAIRPSAGYTSIYTNYGNIENKGFEFSIQYQKRFNRDWSINALFTGSSLKNKIKKMGADLFNTNESSSEDGSNVGAVGNPGGYHWNGHSICREGYAVGSFWGYRVEGVFKSQAEIDAANAKAQAAGHSQYQNVGTAVGDYKYKDLNGDGFIDENDMDILGHGFPKFNYGINVTATYKNWDLTVYGYGVAGQKIYSYSAMRLSTMFASDEGTTPNLLKSSAAQVWSPDNPNGSLPRLSILDPNYNMRGSDAWVKKGDFFKFANIQLGYTFSKELLSHINMQYARVYVAVQNVACISKYNKYGDPEVGQGSVLYTGLDTGRYPQPRSYVLGLSVQF